MVEIVGFDKSVRKRVTCPNCGMILEYGPDEVKSGTARDISGCSDDYNYIICPRDDKVVEV